MLHLLLTRLLPLLARFGYAILLPIAVIEGPAVAMIAGVLVATQNFDAVTSCVLLVLADLVGDAVYYGIGRYAHAPLIEQIGKRLTQTAERLKPLEQRFLENDWKLIMIGKTQALGSVILYFAGATRMPFLRFMVLNLIGTVPKVVLFELVGYFLGRSIGNSVMHSTRYFDYATVTLFGAAMIILVLYFVLRRRLWKDVAGDISV
ncbi:DedA family protein [Phenylobacterium montanum]|uniref:DedA family protein n=1 Tax=Phenylobacterium montanum TaxID=2823693 RepID=A0A975G132_9CAUL|nr:DedA family protein [Caulobacter sp. S6]QUD88016.1 DedA family protein [Caulobacter sp. S6]